MPCIDLHASWNVAQCQKCLETIQAIEHSAVVNACKKSSNSYYWSQVTNVYQEEYKIPIHSLWHAVKVPRTWHHYASWPAAISNHYITRPHSLTRRNAGRHAWAGHKTSKAPNHMLELVRWLWMVQKNSSESSFKKLSILQLFQLWTQIYTCETLSSGLREALDWSKNSLGSNRIVSNFQKYYNSGGACPLTPLAV